MHGGTKSHIVFDGTFCFILVVAISRELGYPYLYSFFLCLFFFQPGVRQLDFPVLAVGIFFWRELAGSCMIHALFVAWCMIPIDCQIDAASGAHGNSLVGLLGRERRTYWRRPLGTLRCFRVLATNRRGHPRKFDLVTLGRMQKSEREQSIWPSPALRSGSGRIKSHVYTFDARFDCNEPRYMLLPAACQSRRGVISIRPRLEGLY